MQAHDSRPVPERAGVVDAASRTLHHVALLMMSCPQRFTYAGCMTCGNRGLVLVLVVGASACAVDPAPESAANVRGDEERGAQPLEREAVAQLQRFQRDARGVRAHLLGRVALTELLAAPGGQAVWLRFGIGPDGEHAVFTAGPGEQAYNFTMPCPNSCPQGASGELLGSSAVALVPGSVEHVGGRIPANRARLLTSAYRGDPTDPVAGLRLERSSIERLLGNREVQGVWFALAGAPVASARWSCSRQIATASSCRLSLIHISEPTRPY